jgi:hypothetical protein
MPWLSELFLSFDDGIYGHVNVCRRIIEEGGQQFLKARERYLDRWMKTIMLTQHNRNILQMKKLRQQIKIFIML